MESDVMSTGVKSLPFMSPSSPPPIDPIYTQDEDEDFGNFTGHDDVFDITGLSQKLTTLNKNNSSFGTSSKLCEENISTEPSVKISINDIPSNRSNDNLTNISNETQNSRCATPDSISISTPPPLDCVGSLHEEHFSEESPVRQIYPLEDHYLEKLSDESERVNEGIEAIPNFISSPLPNVCNDFEISIAESEKINDIADELGSELCNEINGTPEQLDLLCATPVKLLSTEEISHPSDSYSENTCESSSNDAKSPIASINNVDECYEACSPKHLCGSFESSEIIFNAEINDYYNKPAEFLPENDDYGFSEKPCNENEMLANEYHFFENVNTIEALNNIADGDDDSDFGDFADFETTKIEQVVQQELNDDFADVSEEENSELEKELRNKIDMAINDDDDDDDDFGEFNSVSFKDDKCISNIDLKWNENSSDNFTSSCNNSNYYLREKLEAKVSQFDTLILKWVPLEPCFSEDTNTEKTLQKIDEVVDGDAFIWHHLEDIDSCIALKLIWPSSQSNKLFLASLNVDARNIVSKDSMLFGQKWSSSVPLFAQTLSFSPLTPAKPSDTVSANWNLEERGPISPKVTDSTAENHWSLEDRESLANNKKSHSLRLGSIDGDAKDLENYEIIPPAQFDWSSSGLTNPLDTPGLEKEILNDSPPKIPAKRFPNEKRNVASHPSKILEKIMQENHSQSQKTSLESLPPNVRDVVKDLPDLNYMKASVMMFPIRGETDS